MRPPDDSFLDFLRGLGRRGTGWAAVLLLTGIVTTVQLARHERADADAEAAYEFESGAKELHKKIESRLTAHAQVLRSAAAFFTASDHITRSEWHAYIERQRIYQNLLGSQGMGFAAMVPRARLAAHLRELKTSGFPDYRIWPEGERETYSSVILIEPFSGRNLRAFGYDMLTEPVRRTAMEQARDQDIATLSGKVRLVQETDEDVQAGTLMYVPVYRSDASTETLEERRGALVGWVYSPYRMKDLLVAGMLGRWDLAEQRRIRLEIFDGETPSAETLLYDSLPLSTAQSPLAAALHRETVVDLLGRHWLLRFTSAAGMSSVADYRSTWIIFCSGMLTSLLLAGLAFSLANTRFNARAMAERLTADLRRSEERWAFAAEGSGDGMWDWDMATGEVLYSKQWKEMLGYAEPEIGPTLDEWIRRIHPDDLASAMADTQAHINATTSAYRSEHRIRCKDGSWKWILDRGLVVSRDAGGKPLRMIGTQSDISARKQAEAALRESEESYRLLFAGMLDGFALHEIICDDEGRPIDYRFLSVNPAFERLTGLRASEVVGRTVREVMPATETVWIERYGRVALTGEGAEFEEHSAVRDRYFEVAAFRPRPGQFAAIFIDVTASKRAQIALRESEERYRALVEWSPEAIVVHRDGKFIYGNPAAIKMIGATSVAEVTDQTILDRIHPDFHSIARERAQAMTDGQTTLPMIEMKFVRLDGTTIDVEAQSTAITFDGAPARHVSARDITARKRAEVALRRSEERYRTILNASPDDITITDPEGRITMISPAAYAMFGYDQDVSFLHRSITEFIVPEDRARATAQLDLKARGLATGANEYRGLRRDGSAFDIEVNSDFIRDDGGQPAGIVFVVRDITERKRTELALRESERRFRSYIEHSPMGVFIADETGAYVEVNTAAAHITGYSAAELLTMQISDLLPPDALEAGGEHFRQLRECGEARGELPVLRKDGSIGFWIVEAAQISPTRFLGFTVETTERREAEKKLSDSRDLLANLARLVPGVIYQYRLFPDGHSCFPFASAGMEDIYEVTPAEVRDDATPVFGRLHPDDAARVGAAIFESARTLEVFHCEFRVVLPRQGLRWRGSQAHPERMADGGTLWHGIVSDITARKEAELALQTSLSDKDALLKEVHHRVKNNLQVIMSLLRMEGRRCVHADTKSVLGEMQSRIHSMALLHESLYRSGTFAAVDIGSYLNQLAAQSFRTHTTSAGRIQLQLDLASVEVEMDQALPCGLLVNELLSNALKHGFPAGRTGHVRVELQLVAGGPSWRLCVSDTGVGLPADFASRRTQSLGLQLVSDLTNQLRGTLEVAPASGESGAVFTVTFPLSPSKSPAGPA